MACRLGGDLNRLPWSVLDGCNGMELAVVASKPVVVWLVVVTTIQFHQEESPRHPNKAFHCVPGVWIAIVTKRWGLNWSGRSSTAVPVMVGVLTALLLLQLLQKWGPAACSQNDAPHGRGGVHDRGAPAEVRRQGAHVRLNVWLT